MDWSGVAAAALAMAFAQSVKGVTGFGSALLAMPVLLSLLPPREAILLMVCTDLFSGALLVWEARERVRALLVGAMFVGLVPGQWVGTELLAVLDPVWVRRVLGVVVVVLGAQFAWRPVVAGQGELTDLPDSPTRLLGIAALAGAFSGVMSGLVGAAGPPVVAYCKRYYDDQFYRAQLVTLFQLSGMVLAPMLLLKGADVSVLGSVPILLVPTLLGARFGAWLAPRVPRHHFGRATGIILVIAGFALLR